MKFSKISAETFRAYAKTSPEKSFYQTPEIAELRRKSGWSVNYYALFSDSRKQSSNNPPKQNSESTNIRNISTKNLQSQNQILAAAMILVKPVFLNKKIAYCPGGPLVDYENSELLDFFIKNLKNTLKKSGCFSLKISPYYELISRDRHGEILLPEKNQEKSESYKNSSGLASQPKIFDHRPVLKNLQKLGFKNLKTSDIPRYSFILDIDGKSPDELFKNFKSNTRNHIRQVERKGVSIRELDKSELNIFKSITESTSKRRGFSDQPLSYYESMYDLFHPRGEVKFLLAEVDSPRNSKISNPENSKKVNPKKIPLSAAMFMTYGDEVIYLFSGSDEKYMREFNAQYLIQWHMIKYAAENHFKRYNFYGINSLPNKNSKDYGLYSFKKGFDGRVHEMIGTFELPLSSLYYIYKLITKIRF